MFKKATPIFFSLLFFAVPALAQTPTAEPSNRWVLFGAPGLTIRWGDVGAALHLGGGGEKVWDRGVGLGVDLGYLWPPEAVGLGVGIVSAGLIYEFRTSPKFSPYVRGGYTLLFGQGAANLMHTGIGFSRWFDRHRGLRLELRNHLFIQAPGTNITEFSVGFIVGSR